MRPISLLMCLICEAKTSRSVGLTRQQQTTRTHSSDELRPLEKKRTSVDFGAKRLRQRLSLRGAGGHLAEETPPIRLLFEAGMCLARLLEGVLFWRFLSYCLFCRQLTILHLC